MQKKTFLKNIKCRKNSYFDNLPVFVEIMVHLCKKKNTFKNESWGKFIIRQLVAIFPDLLWSNNVIAKNHLF